MRWILALVVFGTFLVAAVSPPRAFAQQDEAEQQQKTAEFVRCWERLPQTQDPEEKISLADRALELEAELLHWPLRTPRDEARTHLWWWLGQGYHNRIRGDRANNAERAIGAFEAGLVLTTREALPIQWADTQNNLAVAYGTRTRGDPADNLERAITAYQAALTVRTRESFPDSWARIQDGLAGIYMFRILGDQAENHEKVIAHIAATMTVRTREASPRDWARTQINLGLVHGSRFQGDRADNLEKAIGHYEAALTVRTREVFPDLWVVIQGGLADIYEGRIHGRRADNLEKAIAYYEAALTVSTREAAPLEWARIQNNLAMIYSSRIEGDRTDNVEKAIAHYEAALKVGIRESFPDLWSRVQTGLGRAYGVRIRGTQADNLERAIAYFEAALSVGTREADRSYWATAKTNVGLAYLSRVQGQRGDNLKKAIDHFEAALSVETRSALPRGHLRTARAFGSALLEQSDWSAAGTLYAGAREAFLLLFGQGINDTEARDVIAQAGPLFAEAAFAAAQRGESEAALALATEGRARMMAVALKLGRDERPRVVALRAAIRAAGRTVEVTQGTERTAAVERLGNLRQELLGLVEAADTAESSGTALFKARALVAQGGAVVVPIVTKVGGKILIVTNGFRTKVPDSEGLTPFLTVLDVPELTTDRLDVLVRGDRKTGKRGGWLAAYSINYLSGSELGRRWPDWLATISNLGPELWHLFGDRLDAALKERGIGSGARLFWLPPGALGILPLGLARNPAGKRRLADDYEVVYAPSLDALVTAQKQIANPASATLAVIINPTGDLQGTEKEGRLVASYFPPKLRTVLERGAATPDAVLAAIKGKTHWHFASHGTFSWTDARQSALVMRGGAPLSVGRLLEADELGRPRLVVLSACETGLYDIDSNPDEFIGLPGTFTALGAAGVLGTLWPVSDAATALLIAKFYELHMSVGLEPPTALSLAQGWLREATNIDLSAYARGAAKQGRLQTRQLGEIEQELSHEGLTRARNAAAVEWTIPDAARASGKKTSGAQRVARPYAHPYFWAGFIYTGL